MYVGGNMSYLFVHFTGESLENGEQIYFSVSDEEFDLGKSLKRHGSVLEITKAEAELLKNSRIESIG